MSSAPRRLLNLRGLSSNLSRPPPAVLVAEEPTAGIDVGTRNAIYDRLADAAREGTAVLLLSSDADEVAAIADRAIVFAHGRPKVELGRHELSPSRIAQECYSE